MKKILYILAFIFFGLFGIVNEGWSDTYTLVTNINQLSAGDKIIITNAGSSQAISTTQNGNNRAQTSVSASNNEITPGNSVQVITLEETGTTNVYYFNVGINAYLYAASSSSNYLRTSSLLTVGNNGKWLISISNNTAYITAQGTNSRNKLKYNSSNNPPIFSCYSSGQNDVKIYKKTSNLVGIITYNNPSGNTIKNDTVNINTIVSEFPTATTNHACIDNRWEFVGWGKTSIAETPISTITITKDTTLYAIYKNVIVAGDYIKDTLTSEITGIKTSSYTVFSDKSLNSTAIYAGKVAGSNTYIQINNNDKKPSIITTQSGGKLKKIILIWDASTSNGRTINVYGKNTAYTSNEDLYDVSTSGDLIGTIIKGISGELTIDGNYEYVGICSNSNAIYLDKIIFEWEKIEGLYEYSTNPKCFSTSITVAEWHNDYVEFDVDNYDSIHTYRDDLENKSCDSIRIELTRNDSSCIRWFHVPIFAGEHAYIDDPKCDVVILKDSVFTPSDGIKNKDVMIYSNGVLKIPEDVTYKVNSLTLRRDNDEIPHLLYNGILDITNDFIFEMRTDAEDWRWIAFPNEFCVSDITNPEVIIKYYDGSYRAQHGKGGWKIAPSDTIFAPGEGFIFGIDINGFEKRIYKFNLDKSCLEDEKSNKNGTQVRACGSDLNPIPSTNDFGWNLVGNPFMTTYNITSDFGVIFESDSLVKEIIDGRWTGGWITEEKDLRYIVIKSDKQDQHIIYAGGYEQICLRNGYKLEPFTSFFVQAKGNGNLIFYHAQRVASAPSRIKTNVDEESFLQIDIGSIKTGCYISNKFTDDYEIGDDLESLYPTYQYINNYKLLYSAINDSIIKSGIKIITPGGKLKLSPETDINDFEEINVLYNGMWYNLLRGETVDIDGEFILYAKRAKNIITRTDDIQNIKIKKYLYNNQIYIVKDNSIFTTLGRQVK